MGNVASADTVALHVEENTYTSQSKGAEIVIEGSSRKTAGSGPLSGHMHGTLDIQKTVDG